MSEIVDISCIMKKSFHIFAAPPSATGKKKKLTQEEKFRDFVVFRTGESRGHVIISNGQENQEIFGKTNHFATK